jgi:hypothetical protein
VIAVYLIEGENVLVDRQFMSGREDQYPTVRGDLERRVDVIVVSGPPTALAAKKVVTKVLVIFAAVGDPVAIGLLHFDGVFRLIVTERLNGLLVIGGPVNVIHQKRIIEFTASQRLPAISISRDYVDEGGLMSYGASLADNIGHAATYVAKIRNDPAVAPAAGVSGD